MTKSSVDNRAMDKVEAVTLRVMHIRWDMQWRILYDVQYAIEQAKDVKDAIEEAFLFVIPL